MLVLRIERKRRLYPQNCIGQLPRALHRLARQTVGSRYCVSYRAAMLMRSPLARDRRKPPGFIRPCQPVLSAKVPIGDGWIHELKHDGFRIVALKAGDDVRLWSRHGRDWSAEFVAITAALMALPFTRIVLDASELQRAPAPLWVRYSVPLRLRPDPRRRRGSARARARRAPGPAPQAPQARRRRDHLQR